MFYLSDLNSFKNENNEEITRRISSTLTSSVDTTETPTTEATTRFEIENVNLYSEDQPVRPQKMTMMGGGFFKSTRDNEPILTNSYTVTSLDVVTTGGSSTTSQSSLSSTSTNQFKSRLFLFFLIS